MAMSRSRVTSFGSAWIRKPVTSSEGDDRRWSCRHAPTVFAIGQIRHRNFLSCWYLPVLFRGNPGEQAEFSRLFYGGCGTPANDVGPRAEGLGQRRTSACQAVEADLPAHAGQFQPTSWIAAGDAGEEQVREALLKLREKPIHGRFLAAPCSVNGLATSVVAMSLATQG